MRGSPAYFFKRAASFMTTYYCSHHHLRRRLSLDLLSPRVATPAVAMSTDTDAVIQQKRAIRSQVRRALKAFSPDQRSREDMEIQRIILESPWFKSSKGLCAYISCEALLEVDTSRILAEILKNPDYSDHDTQVKKKLYVPRIEDKNSRMRMLKISSIDDLVPNSMNILEPSHLNADGTGREDVMFAGHPVDIFLLPGVAFDRHGKRLGRGGGYYDVFLKKYQELAIEHSWKMPLLVALAYSLQILEDDVIPKTSNDFPIDALVSPSEVIRITPAALEKM